MQDSFIEALWSDIEAIRETRPLVHNITNAVVTNFSANALLALGASPLMAHAPEELEEIVGLSQALVINIGTLDGPQINSMSAAIGFANKKRIPVIIDPVGAGASRFRTGTAQSLMNEADNLVVKGNGGEILALANQEAVSKGVDSLYGATDASAAARHLIARFGAAAVAVTGEEDIVLDASGSTLHGNGSALMPGITGMGCILTALIGAFAAVNGSAAGAARHAVSYAAIAGEVAAASAAGPGSFVATFLDQLYNLKKADLRGRIRVRIV